MILYHVVIFFTIFGIAIALPLPSYIKACSVSDPNFQKCSLQNAREAIPYILKGDRRYGFPNLVPLNLPAVTFPSGTPLNISLKNVYIYGLENIHVENVLIKTDEKKVSLELQVPRLEFIGHYNISGKILVIPIKGDGNFNITAVEGIYKYNFKYDLRRSSESNNLEYLTMKPDDKLTFDMEKAYIKLDNLFNGDKELGEQMNIFLNEHWQDVLAELGGTISETIGAIARSILSGIFNKVPMQEILLD